MKLNAWDMKCDMEDGQMNILEGAGVQKLSVKGSRPDLLEPPRPWVQVQCLPRRGAQGEGSITPGRPGGAAGDEGVSEGISGATKGIRKGGRTAEPDTGSVLQRADLRPAVRIEAVDSFAPKPADIIAAAAEPGTLQQCFSAFHALAAQPNIANPT